jgi:hypothetical protein
MTERIASEDQAKRCDLCRHWQRYSTFRGGCSQSAHTSSTYRLVGSAGVADVLEETRPDHWCVLFDALLTTGEPA